VSLHSSVGSLEQDVKARLDQIEGTYTHTPTQCTAILFQDPQFRFEEPCAGLLKRGSVDHGWAGEREARSSDSRVVSIVWLCPCVGVLSAEITAR
jgi:hypothetical protein